MSYDISGAVDLHLHCGPEGIPRAYDAVKLGEYARAHHLGSLVLKSHFTSTSAWAHLAHGVTGFRLYGSVTLNHHVGGINPFAVRGALGPSDERGSFLKLVWLPTIHAEAHLAARRAAGDIYDIPAEWCGGVLAPAAQRIDEIAPISILAPEVQAPLKEVLRLIAEHRLVLATGHVGPKEVFHVVEMARAAGVERIVATHVQYEQPGLDLAEMRELVAAGVHLELCYVLHELHMVDLASTAEIIRTLGPERIVISTDLGHANGPYPGQGLIAFAEALMAQGIDRRDLDIAIKRNPAALIAD